MPKKEKPVLLEEVSKYKSQKSRMMRRSSQSKSGLDIGPYDCDDEYSDIQDEVNNDTQHNEAFIEDSRKSGFTSKALMLIEHSLLLLVLLSIIISIQDQELSRFAAATSLALALQSAISLILMGLTILRYKLHLRLKKDQKIQAAWDTLFNIEYMPKLVAECLILLIHPNIVCQTKTVILFQPYDSVYLSHSLNDLLSLAMLARGYIILRTVIATTIYSSPRASRLCRLYGCEHSYMFAIKCIMQEVPIKALSFLFLLSVILYGHGLRLSEQNTVLEIKSEFDLSNFDNCLWCIVITMGTIGYGDYYPRTYPGRVITIFAAITGVTISSLLIITLSAYLSMSPYESKAHITLERLKIRRMMEQLARETIKQTAMVSYKLKTEHPELKGEFYRLKDNVETVKMIIRKLQTVVETDNVNEEMYRLFEVLKVNMKEIYVNQLKMKKLLSRLYKTERKKLRDIKFSFTNQIESMIKG